MLKFFLVSQLNKDLHKIKQEKNKKKKETPFNIYYRDALRRLWIDKIK